MTEMEREKINDKKYSYREKMYHDLRDKLRNNEDVTITDLSNALWLYEKAFEAYEKMSSLSSE
ncbi:hypothetical protein MY48_08515 [Listeria monocytogenes]|nr:hypothetical protein [Listeria monocytogenes]